MKRNLIIMFLIIFNILVYSVNISFIKKKQLILKGKDGNFIQLVYSFFVTNEDYIYLLDFKAGNMKVFNNNGKFIKNIGRKGQGPDEYIKLYTSAYNNEIFFIYDVRRKKIFNYKIKKNNEIDLIYKRKVFNNIVDLKLIDNKLLLTGNFVKINGKFKQPTYYTCSIYDPKINKYNYLLTLAYCNNFKPGGLYKNGVAERIFASRMGGYADSSTDYIFYAKMSKLKIFRIDRKNFKKKIFGNKTKNYSEFVSTSEMTRALRKRDRKKYKLLIQHMSLVKDCFVINNKYLGILYTNYIKKNDNIDIYLQLYDMSGKFIYEKLLLHSKSFHADGVISHFQKTKNILYILDTETTEEFDQVYRMNKFSIKF